MYPTSTLYDSAVYATARTVAGKVTFAIVDTTAIGDISSITVTTQAAISSKDQVANGVRDITYNLITWETDRFRLDGSFSFPDSTVANNGEVGYISNELSNSSRQYSVNDPLDNRHRHRIAHLFIAVRIGLAFCPSIGESLESFTLGRCQSAHC